MSDAIEWATGFLDGMIAGDFAALVEKFDDSMRQVMPAEGLEVAWEQLTLQAGAYQARGEGSVEVQEGYHVALIPITFEHGELNFRIIYHADGKVAGFHFKPAL